MHDDVIRWKHFPRYWSFVREFTGHKVISSHKGQWRGTLIFFIFSLICTWTIVTRVIWDPIVLIIYYITVMTRMWCLSLCSSLTPYNITFPFGTFINIYVVQCRLILKRCLQLHVKGVNICLHLTHLCYHYLQSITLNPQRYWQTHITLVSQIVFLNHEYIENGKYIRSVL